MREPIKFQFVRTDEELADAEEFAASFGHQITCPDQPVVMLSRGEKPIGYFQMIQRPVITFAFHNDPAVCSPRDFLEAVEAVRSWQLLSTMTPATPNGVCYTLRAPDSPIPEEVMERVGLHDTGMKLYRSA